MDLGSYLLDIQTSAPTNWVQIITLILACVILFVLCWPFWHR